MSKQHFIHKVLKEVVEDMNADEKIIAQYFSPSYIQHVDGHTLNYDAFIEHMLAQKAILASANVTIERCVTEGDHISTIHVVDAIKKSGEPISVKVIAHMEITDGKITFCDELTHVLKGQSEDRKISSVH